MPKLSFRNWALILAFRDLYAVRIQARIVFPVGSKVTSCGESIEIRSRKNEFSTVIKAI